MSTFLPAAISNEYIFVSADIAYAFKSKGQHQKSMEKNNQI